MVTFLNQILGGTRLDTQGESLPLEALESLCENFLGRRIPLHQKHSMAEPTLGYIENLHLTPDNNDKGKWSLVGDVYVTHGTLDEALKGFSISLTLPLREVANPDILLYIPFPHYNNAEFVADLSTDPKLTIGKWIKKEADPTALAIFGSVVVLIITPIWDDIYKRKIAPKIYQFLENHFSRIQNAGIGFEHQQILDYESHEIAIRFIPAAGIERYCFDPDLLRAGISYVIDHLKSDSRAKSPGVERIVLKYDIGSRTYTLFRIEYKDGDVAHH
jgi:hypothetical protein